METATKANLKDARAAWRRIVDRASGLLVDQPPSIDTDGLQRYRDHFNKQVDDLAQRLSTGDITVNQWQRAMGEEIERLHLTGWAIGRGGVSNMGRNDLRQVQRKIGEQKQYLDRWAGELRQQRRRGEEFSSSTVANRAKLYGGASNATVNQANTASIGLPRLPQYPGDGRTRCRTNCHCTVGIQKLRGDGNWNVTWKLGSAEHCEDCEELARQWNPLRIRGGVIVD